MQKKNKNKYPSIPENVIIFMSWRNLLEKKLRSFLTIIGIVIGVGAIFFLVSLGLGLQQLVTNEVIGGNTVKSIDITSPNSKIIKLDSENSKKIQNLPNVDKLGKSYSYASSLSINGSEIDAITYGIDQNYQEMSDFSIIGGGLMRPKDTKSAIINKATLEAIGIDSANKVIGSELSLNIPLKDNSGSSANKNKISETFKIAGVIDSGTGSEVFIPDYIFSNAGVRQYSQLKLVPNNIESTTNLRGQIESLGFETKSPLDTVNEINQIFRYFNIILAGFGSIGMVVAVLGMFNTLTITLLERSKEIGLMMALGARNKDMRKLFIYEATMLSIIGSVAGITLAVIVAKVTNVILNNFAQNRGVNDTFSVFATPAWLIFSLIAAMVLVGLIVVYIPSKRAEKINPIDALRR
ncbi:ABC transporter permease [Candidatus Saccharibacteria bacterium]|jgi:putative ABC transport system permease protein|nr:ABC transporter permease [Candidatus Saccharibacteria bacterium]